MTVIKPTGLARTWLACAGALLLAACGSSEPDPPPAQATATATADSYTLDWNAAKTLAVLDNDVSSGGTAQLSIVESPMNGSISVEHVRNVLGRLNAPKVPEQAETALQLTLVPKADTARYDRLRASGQDDQEVIHA